MVKRQTSVRLSALTDDKIRAFVEAFDMTAVDVISAAVEMYYREEFEKRKAGAVYAPIYNSVFVIAKDDDLTSFAVRSSGDDNATRLKEVQISDISNGVAVYTEIKHHTEWPYGAIDFEEIVTESDKELSEISGIEIKPRRFCQAALVATPKLSLF